MAQVFLSYDREDGAKARALAAALKRAGHEVWWDRHIAGGAQYNREIERALADADAVVVLWSKHSIDSAWVRDETAAGRERNCLVPVTIDGTAPPLGFRQYQTMDLQGWKGSGRSTRFAALLHALAATPGTRAAEPTPSSPTAQASSRSGSARPWLLAIVGLLLVAVAWGAWRSWNGRSAAPVVAVAASDDSAQSNSLARDLLIKLGTLQAARADAMRLVEAGRGRSDLLFEAQSEARGGQVEASLALLAGADRSLLWSKQFVQPAQKEADLRQSLAVAAGRVLNCALDALTEKQAKLRPQVLKLYLNGCASFDELAYGELRQLIPVMREVTRRAPKFSGAWGKLIQAQVLTAVAGAADPAILEAVRKDIAAARRSNPHLAEAYLAEVELLPHNAYAERLRLVELAIRHNPEHPEPYAAGAYYLRFVGRMADSVASAKGGSELNPLSPALRYDYLNALAHAGQLDAARRELQQAEELWPGSSVIADARFRFNLRYGDPHAAMGEQQSAPTLWTPRLTATYLEARVAPTPANIEAAVREAHAVTRQEPQALGVLIQTLATFGRTNEIITLLLSGRPNIGGRDIAEVLFRPQLQAVRHDPRFMTIARRLRLIDYWQSSGKWPDFCFEPDLPYDCKEEASKVA